MPALLEKLLGYPSTCLPVTYAGALLAAIVEWALGKVSAQSIVDTFALTADERTEAQSLRDAIANGNAALVGATPLQRIMEVQNVLLLGDARCPPYSDAAAVRTRLGI